MDGVTHEVSEDVSHSHCYVSNEELLRLLIYRALCIDQAEMLRETPSDSLVKLISTGTEDSG